MTALGQENTLTGSLGGGGIVPIAFRFRVVVSNNSRMILDMNYGRYAAERYGAASA